MTLRRDLAEQSANGASINAPGSAATAMSSGMLTVTATPPHTLARIASYSITVPGRVAKLGQWSSVTEAERHLTTIRSSRNQTGAHAIHVIRDYGITDRREAPQYMPKATAPILDPSIAAAGKRKRRLWGISACRPNG